MEGDWQHRKRKESLSGNGKDERWTQSGRFRVLIFGENLRRTFMIFFLGIKRKGDRKAGGGHTPFALVSLY